MKIVDEHLARREFFSKHDFQARHPRCLKETGLLYEK